MKKLLLIVAGFLALTAYCNIAFGCGEGDERPELSPGFSLTAIGMTENSISIVEGRSVVVYVNSGSSTPYIATLDCDGANVVSITPTSAAGKDSFAVADGNDSSLYTLIADCTELPCDVAAGIQFAVKINTAYGDGGSVHEILLTDETDTIILDTLTINVTNAALPDVLPGEVVFNAIDNGDATSTIVIDSTSAVTNPVSIQLSINSDKPIEWIQFDSSFNIQTNPVLPSSSFNLTMTRIDHTDPENVSGRFSFVLASPSGANVTISQSAADDSSYDQNEQTASSNLPITFDITGPDCMAEAGIDISDPYTYSAFVEAGKPDCWCQSRQCHGNADGKMDGTAKTGFYAVGTSDLDVMMAGWLVKEPLGGPGIANVPDVNGIKAACGNFNQSGYNAGSKCYYSQIGTNDLDILMQNWYVKEPPFGPGVPADCLPGNVPSDDVPDVSDCMKEAGIDVSDPARYAAWIEAGKPECWCYPRQCYGDADGEMDGLAKTGYYAVGTGDLDLLIAAWQVREPSFGPGVASIPPINGVPVACANFDNGNGDGWGGRGGSSKGGYYHVGTSDLDILIANWTVKEPTFGPGVPADCFPGNR